MRMILQHVRHTQISLYKHQRFAGSWYWLQVVCLILVAASLSSDIVVHAQTAGHIAALRKETEDLFYHGYHNYRTHAFPEDELRPITCKPLTRDRDNPANIGVNDPLGNYSVTLVDSLSTLAILASSPSDPDDNRALILFQDGVRDMVIQYGDGSDGPSGTGVKATGFDLDSKVQVFETVIRGVGGLLSAHLFAVGDLPIKGYNPPKAQVQFAQDWHKDDRGGGKQSGIIWPNGFEYDGQLLRLAYDLGSRLLPAFWSSTGIPYPRVNLRHGIPFYSNSPLNAHRDQCDASQKGEEVTETCTAGAGSLVLEFTVLSRLTADARFEDLAKRAFWAIWDRRSSVDLVGSGIDAESGNWIGTWTGIGAGIDSFFEYALKSHILLSRNSHPIYEPLDEVLDPRILFDSNDTLDQFDSSPDAFLSAFSVAHAAIKRHLYRGTNFQHPHYIQADLVTGAARGFWIDALSAFYPGTLTLAGHVEEAVETHLLQTALWTRFSALPERWNLATGGIDGGLGWWVGRPEFIESNYYLYRATEDPWYIHVAEMTLRDMKRRCWTRCGWASIQNVLTGEKSDRMESFFLGETAKYLFLTFDPDHPLNHLDEPFVFTTEGHPLLIPRSVGSDFSIRPLVSQLNDETCPPAPKPLPFSISNTAARTDVYHAASLARLHLMPKRQNVSSFLGDYAADHPSITLSDISSPTNYTHFPWTLPPHLIPHDAVSSPLKMRPVLDISFPQIPSLNAALPPLQRVREGILINSLSNLRLNMILDLPTFVDDEIQDSWRIHSINNIPLGKDEKVFLARDTGKNVLSASDPHFTSIRDQKTLDLVIDLDEPVEAPDLPDEELTLEILEDLARNGQNAIHAALKSFVSSLSSLIPHSSTWPFKTPLTLSSSTPKSAEKKGPARYHISAVTPTGPGTAPLPDWDEVSGVGGQGKAVGQLTWGKVYLADELCESKLSRSVVRDHQILLIRRGGCTFSEKLANIPNIVPGASSLQLVVIVDFGDDTGDEGDASGEPTIRPYLDKAQFTPGGLPRRNPIPMVMVGGGQRVWDALGRARGVGIKRRYWIESKGERIANLVIL